MSCEPHLSLVYFTAEYCASVSLNSPRLQYDPTAQEEHGNN